MSRNNDFFDFVGGLIVGGIIGSAIAALTTPYSGDEARDELNRKYKLGLERSKELKHKAEESIGELRTCTKEKVGTVLHKLKNKANSIASCFEDLTNKGAGVLIEDEIV